MLRSKQSGEFLTELFQQPSLAALREEVNPAEHGKDLGENNLPRPDAEAFSSSVENHIINRVGLSKNQNYEILLGQIEAQNKLLNQEPGINMGKRAAREFSDLIQLKMDEIRALFRNKDKEEHAFENFQKNNNLDRPPIEIESGIKVLLIGIMAPVVLVETIVNSNFLQKGSDLGFLGPLTIALTITFLNVVVPFFVAYEGAFRGIRHIERRKRIIAWGYWCLYVTLILIFNLAVAHYREKSEYAFASGETDEVIAGVGIQVIEAMLSSNLFNFLDFETWILFAVGIFFSIFAVIDASKLNDPYPDYGRHYARLQKIRKKCLERREVLILALQEKIKLARREYDIVDGEDRGFRLERHRISESCNYLFSSFDIQLAQLETSARTLISEFYEANVKARTDGKIPAYFNRQWEITNPMVNRDLSTIMISEEEIDKKIAEIKKELGEIIRHMESEFDKIVMELNPNRVSEEA